MRLTKFLTKDFNYKNELFCSPESLLWPNPYQTADSYNKYNFSSHSHWVRFGDEIINLTQRVPFMKSYQQLRKEEGFYIWQARQEGARISTLPKPRQACLHYCSRTQMKYLCPASFLYLSLGHANLETSETPCQSI